MYYHSDNQNKGSMIPIMKLKAFWEEGLYSETEILSPKDALELIAPKLLESPVELACVIFLNSGGMPICVASVGQGDKATVTFDARQIAQMGLLCDASLFIMVHNHPDYIGYKNLLASQEDCVMTENIAKICAPLGLFCYDSIIVNMSRQPDGKLNPAYYSMKMKKPVILDRANGIRRPSILSKEKLITGEIPWLTSKDLKNVKSCWESGSFPENVKMEKSLRETLMKKNSGELTNLEDHPIFEKE